MNKFKIGDKVRRIKYDYKDCKVGEVYEVTYITDYFLSLKGVSCKPDPDHFELVEDTRNYFKVGDRVRSTVTGIFAIVIKVSDNGERIDIKCDPLAGVYADQLSSYYELVPEDTSKYHPHYDTIVAWAKGAEIQAKLPNYGGWICTAKPRWDAFTEYRVKPTNPAASAELEKLQQQIKDLQEQVDKLEKEM